MLVDGATATLSLIDVSSMCLNSITHDDFGCACAGSVYMVLLHHFTRVV